MIEAFDEVGGDRDAVEECQIWLLKQKQTQNWRTTKATADAVYALLQRGANLLSSDALVKVSLAGQELAIGKVEPDSATNRNLPPTDIEPGTGFYEIRFPAAEVSAEQAEVKVAKSDRGIAWGSVHWQYFEDIGNVQPYEGTPLKLVKKLFKKVNTANGPELQPVASSLAVGDELVVRLELRVDRDMEFVHLKDQRGSGTEPVNVLSGHRFQDG
jgi:hypothetical protein